jgi:hypothetical protein
MEGGSSNVSDNLVLPHERIRVTDAAREGLDEDLAWPGHLEAHLNTSDFIIIGICYLAPVVCRILYKAGFKKVKKTTKSGLNEVQKEKRFRFCRKYQY